jgi:hypothetical protein
MSQIFTRIATWSQPWAGLVAINREHPRHEHPISFTGLFFQPRSTAIIGE